MITAREVMIVRTRFISIPAAAAEMHPGGGDTEPLLVFDDKPFLFKVFENRAKTLARKSGVDLDLTGGHETAVACTYVDVVKYAEFCRIHVPNIQAAVRTINKQFTAGGSLREPPPGEVNISGNRRIFFRQMFAFIPGSGDIVCDAIARPHAQPAALLSG